MTSQDSNLQASAALGQSGLKEKADSFPIVGLGASAGGLKAFVAFFDAMSAESGMAFVLVQHLDPYHESELAELLQRHTPMAVAEVEDQVQVERDHVYIIPPGKSLTIRGGTLHLQPPHQPRGRRTPIDDFFRSLASEAGEQAISIILSGTGSDGTLGLKSIKENGGVVMVQTPTDAEYDGMPKNAITTGLVDVVAPAAELARKLVEVQRHADLIQRSAAAPNLTDDNIDTLFKILTQLRTQTGYDFNPYKRATILRRIQRRMQVNEIDQMANYLGFLRNNRGEAEALFKDFLIAVTNFFRDADAFAALERLVIPHLYEGKTATDSVRIWVPGCATGEEAYSLAMLLSEAREQQQWQVSFQIFASDLDEQTLAFARTGLYPETIVADVSAERLERFFIHETHGYRVKEEIAKCVLFAHHNLLKDPPFSKLDLLSCRNLLIYLERDIQQHVFDLFHYALRAGGFLFLGGSETAEGMGDRFRTVDKKRRLYQRRTGPSRLTQMPLTMLVDEGAWRNPREPVAARPPVRLGDLHRQLMLERYAPPSLLIDSNNNIRYLFGDVGRYLRPAEGEPTHNILQNIRGEFRVELRTVLYQFFQKGEQALEPRLITLGAGETRETILLKVTTAHHAELPEDLALVIFEPVQMRETPTGREAGTQRRYDDQVVEQLEDELQRTRHRLQTVVEEYETANEELKAANEELQSANEELRSTAEELETSKEELQSTNEELHTVNNELKTKIEEVSQINSDLQNLMASTQIATLFLDRELCLKRYTPQATELFNLIPTDIGRPFAHLSHKIDHADLAGLADRVLHQLRTVEEEVQGKTGRWFFMRMLPYRSLEDKIEGVVATFVDITASKHYQQALATRERQQAALAELGQVALAGLELRELMERAVRQVAATLNVPLCKVLELQPGGETLLLRAGVGWHAGLVGAALVGAGQASQAGYTLRTHEPVIVENFAEEKRFSGPKLLREHDVVSGLSVIIGGQEQPYGVLGAHTTEQRHFSAQDVHFIQAVANLLGVALARQAAEAAMLVNEERYRTALKYSSVIFAKVDAALRYEWIYNPHPDFDANGVVGKRDDELARGAGVEALAQFKQEVFARGEQARREITIDLSDGAHTYELIATPLRNAQGEVTHLLTAALDVSERKQMQEALRESKALFEAVLQNLPMGVIVAAAPSGQLLLGNAQVAEIWGQPFHTVNALEGYRLYKGYHPDGTPYQPEEWPLARTLTTGALVQNEEMHFERGDGTRGTLLVSAVPVTDEQGVVRAGVIVFNEITARQQAEEALRVLTERLEQRVLERTLQIRTLASELTLAEQRERHQVALILHDDLQQLLFAIHFHFHLLKDALAAQNLGEGAAILVQMRELILRSITVTRTLAIDLSPPVLPGEGLVEAVKWLGQQMQELHGLQIEVKAAAPLHLASEGMRVLLFHIIRELLFNVVKHAGVRKAQVAFEQTNSLIRICVADQGKGFAVAVLSEPKSQQSGLGFFHMRERLHLFGGELELQSDEGAGTCAVITLPFSMDALTTPQEEAV